MEAFRLRTLKSGAEYEHLFPRANGADHTVRRNASLDHTMDYIPKVVERTLSHTKRLAAALKGKNVYETCSNLWQFVYQHIQYRKDRPGYEQIRSPARAWHDRGQGVDCDCYSVFISSVLTNLGIPHTLRITKYKQAHFQHIYPIVPHEGSYITMDCVTDSFDYEVPYSEKKDYPMELQYLDGIPGLYGDANEIYLLGADNDLGELGKLIKKNMAAKKVAALPVAAAAVKKPNIFQKIVAKAKTSPPPIPPPSDEPPKPKKKKFIAKVLNKVNKINPATVLLRNGVLASMKLNVKNVAGRLRWSYLTPQQAAQRGIDPERFKRLVATRQKLENIFYGAGGKPDNLKKAILDGKGNKDKAISGLGALSFTEGLAYIDAHTPLQTLLGREIYYSENVEGMDGFSGLGELGEPVTLASVAAAAGVIAGIVGSLKQIGDIFKGKGKGSEDFSEENTGESIPATATPAPSPLPPATISVTDQAHNVSTQTYPLIEEKPPETSTIKPQSTQQESSSEFLPTANKEAAFSNEIAKQEAGITDALNPSTGSGSNTPDEKPGFWEKNKSWLKPTAIVGGGIAIVAIGYYLSKPKKSSSKTPGLAGFPRGKKKNHHRKGKHKQKIAVALL